MEQWLAPPLLLALQCVSGLVLTQANECNITEAGRLDRWDVKEAEQLLNLVIVPVEIPDSLIVQWQKPIPDVLSYLIVLYDVTTNVLQENASVGPDATSFKLEGLTSGTQYDIQVTAVTNCSEFPAQKVSAWTKPLAVHNVSLRAGIDPWELTASWDEPLGGKEGYLLTLYHAKSNTVARNQSIQKDFSEYQFHSLDPGSEYTLEISTLSGPYRSSTRESGWTYPLPPSKVTLQNTHSSFSLNAAWDNPFGAAWFHLALYKVDSLSVIRAVSVERGVDQYTFQELTPGIEYCLVIAAATGPYRTLGPNATGWTYPLAPSNVSLMNSGSTTTLHAQWTPSIGELDSYLLLLLNTETKDLQKNISTGENVTAINLQGLTPGTQYMLTVTAIAGPYQATAKESVAWTNPLAPSNVSLMNSGSTTTLQAQWTPSAGELDSYLLLLRHTETKDLPKNLSTGKNVTAIELQGLTPGTQYTLTVTAIAGPYQATTQESAAWTNPLAPSGLNLSSQGTLTTLYACWDPTPCSGYVVKLHIAKPWVLVQNSSLGREVTNYTFQLLSPGTLYVFEITVLAGPHTSSPKTTTEWTHPLPPDHVSLIAQESGNSSILMASWQAPLYGADYTYSAMLLETMSEVLVKNMTLNEGETELPLEGLVSGRQYTLHVYTMGGPYTSHVETATNWTYPSSPLNVMLTNHGHASSLSASWVTPSGDSNGFSVHLYNSEFQLERNASIGPGLYNLMIDGLQPGNKYTLEMSTIAGPYLSHVATATEWTNPLVPTPLLVENGQSSSSLFVHWTPVISGGKLWLKLYTNNSLTVPRNISVDPGITNLTIEHLQPGTRYLLQAVSQAGPYQTASSTVTSYTHPLAPSSLKISSKGSQNTLVIQWENPDGERDHYFVSLSMPEAGTVLQNLTTDKKNTEVTFTGLTPGSWYTVHVKAVAGNHFKSIMKNITACTVPLSPSIVELTNGGSSTMLHSTWTAPVGGRDSYRLILISELTQLVVRDVSIGNNHTKFTFNELSAGNRYTVMIAAVCQEHESFSPNLTEWTYPLAPSNVILFNLGNPTSLFASWADPSGWREEYKVTLYEASSWTIAGFMSVRRSTKNCTFENLKPGKHYSAEASAVSGPYKATVNNVTNSTCPFAPLNVQLIQEGYPDRLQASWDEAEGERDGYEAILHNVKSQTIAGMASVDGDTKRYVFTGLNPGSEFMVQIAAFTGVCRNSSKDITEWTLPLPSPSVGVDNEGSHDRLRVFWEDAAGDRNRYTVVLYDASGHVVIDEASVEEGAKNYNIYGLTPGCKYAAEVVSVAGPYRVAAPHITHWTYPLAPTAVHATNAGSADELNVFWDEDMGERDGYVAVLYDSVAHTIQEKASVSSDTYNHTFSALTPGRKYFIEIAALAGPYGTPAANVTAWTYPLAPPKVKATNKGSPFRLHAFWEEAMGDRDRYSAILYEASSFSVVRNSSVRSNTRDFTFSRLTPGNKYNIEIEAVAGTYRASAAKITDWTYPLAPRNVSVVIEENNTVLVLSWSKSGGLLDYYKAGLLDLWNKTGSKNQTVDKKENKQVFKNLMPGRNYSVSVSSVAGPYHSSSESVLVSLEPKPVTAALCWANETGLYLNWTHTREETDSCRLDVGKLSDGISQPLLTLLTTENEASLRNLAPNTSYQIELTLIGSNGLRSPTVILVCKTSQEVQPPPPSNSVPLFDVDSGVIISSDMFSEVNGRIEYYGIIVTSNTSLSRPTQQITTSTWYDHYYGHEDTYLAVLVLNPFEPSERDSASKTTWAVPIGTEECSQTREICNGKLKADTQYRFSVAAFTRYDILDPAVSFSAFSASPSDDDSSSVPVPVVAGVVTGILLTALAVLGIVYWRRSRLRRTKKNHPTQEMTAYTLRNIHRSIPVQNFKQMYEMKSAGSSQMFFQEFEELKEVGKDQSRVEAELPANVSKNRYPHVLPYDHSRVKLNPVGDDSTSDYINANFIPGYTGYQEYICTQGPLKKTIEDFWRLIWEYNVRNIVMLTVCMENGRVLCDHYWPSYGPPVTYGLINVRLVAQDISSEWTMREFRLWHVGLKLEREIHQLHYTSWPDHGLPESTTSIIYFVELVQEQIQLAKGSGPTLVLSSAGVGRTGTFIGLERILRQMKQERVVDIFHAVYTMRMSRYLMVQTLRQYIFLHTCILDKITEEQLLDLGDKETCRPLLQKTFSQHYLKKSANGNAGFLQEYEVLLEAAKDDVGVDFTAPAIVNHQAHTYSAALPYDRCKVKFSPLGPTALTDVEKAWFIPGFNSTKDYLAIHGPEEDTVEQFWRMAWDHNVHTIVTLMPFDEKEELPGTEIWRMDASPICAGSLSVHLTAVKDARGWKCTHLKMKHEKKMKERMLHHFCFPLWDDQDEPNAESIIKFLVALRQSVPSRKRSTPLLIHCSAGVGQMGIILALDWLLHQAKADKSVDVYGVTLRIAKSCCFMTPTLDQYVFLHGCLKTVLSEKQL